MPSNVFENDVPGGSQGVLQEIVAAWEASTEQPSAQAVVRSRPELGRNKSLVVKLAYEEYRLRRQRGEELDPQGFCEQFTSCQFAVRRMLSVHQAMVEDHPSWMEQFSQGWIESDDLWPVPGEEFLGFRLLDEVGRGGLARVFLAQEHSIGNRLVVLKLTLRETGEARIMGRLQHPGIMPIHHVDFDQERNLHAVVMPFHGTTTLYDVLDAAFPKRQGPPPRTAEFLREVSVAGAMGRETSVLAGKSIFGDGSRPFLHAVVDLGVRLAEALAYTHRRGVLHRDLKPSNILLTPQGLPLLMDFNLSARTDGPGLLAGGTVPYMPPEHLAALAQSESVRLDTNLPPFGSTWNTICQEECTTNDLRADTTNRDFGGWVTTADPRSDLFSCGVILYELLTGQLPFGEPDVRQPVRYQAEWVLKRQKNRPLERHSDNQHIPEPLFQIICRCLNLDPQQRPSTANELARELDAVLADLEAAAREKEIGKPVCELPEPSVEPMSMQRWLRHAALGVSVVATLLSVLAVAQASRRSIEPRVDSIAIDEAPGLGGVGPTDDLDTPSHDELAANYLAQGRWSEALIELQTAARQGAPAAENNALQAYCLLQDNFFQSAANKGRAAVQAGNASAAVLNNLAYAQLKTQRHMLARRNLQEALALAPQEPAIRFNLACLELDEKNLDAAVEHIELALLGPKSSELHWNAALIFAELAVAKPELARRAEEQVRLAAQLGVDQYTGTRLPATLQPYERVLRQVVAENVTVADETMKPNGRTMFPVAP